VAIVPQRLHAVDRDEEQGRARTDAVPTVDANVTRAVKIV
jgi:hypothetical protein